MKLSLKTCTAIAIMSSLPFVAGCGTQTPTTSLANPASEYCLSLSGKLELLKEKAGEKALCHLPNGTVIEEWELYRRNHADKSRKRRRRSTPALQGGSAFLMHAPVLDP